MKRRILNTGWNAVALTAAVTLSVLLLSSCDAIGSKQESHPDGPSPTGQEKPDIAPGGNDQAKDPKPLKVEDVRNIVWRSEYRTGFDDSNSIPLTEGKYDLYLDGGGSVHFNIGESVVADLNSDGYSDLAVELEQRNGNGVSNEWYLWVASSSGAKQVLEPVARTTKCGDVVSDVSVAEGGVEITEYLRNYDGSDDDVPCAGTGSNFQKRTVKAVWSEELQEWWPMRIAPAEGFGGICPKSDMALKNGMGELSLQSVFPMPDQASRNLQSGQQLYFYELDESDGRVSEYPGWKLIGVSGENSTNYRCGWVEASSQ